MTDLEYLARETATKCQFGSGDSRSEHILAALREVVTQRDELLRQCVGLLDDIYWSGNNTLASEIIARYEALMKEKR